MLFQGTVLAPGPGDPAPSLTIGGTTYQLPSTGANALVVGENGLQVARHFAAVIGARAKALRNNLTGISQDDRGLLIIDKGTIVDPLITSALPQEELISFRLIPMHIQQRLISCLSQHTML